MANGKSDFQQLKAILEKSDVPIMPTKMVDFSPLVLWYNLT